VVDDAIICGDVCAKQGANLVIGFESMRSVARWMVKFSGGTCESSANNQAARAALEMAALYRARPGLPGLTFDQIFKRRGSDRVADSRLKLCGFMGRPGRKRGSMTRTLSEESHAQAMTAILQLDLHAAPPVWKNAPHVLLYARTTKNLRADARLLAVPSLINRALLHNQRQVHEVQMAFKRAYVELRAKGPHCIVQIARQAAGAGIDRRYPAPR